RQMCSLGSWRVPTTGYWATWPSSPRTTSTASSRSKRVNASTNRARAGQPRAAQADWASIASRTTTLPRPSYPSRRAFSIRAQPGPSLNQVRPVFDGAKTRHRQLSRVERLLLQKLVLHDTHACWRRQHARAATLQRLEDASVDELVFECHRRREPCEAVERLG